MTLILLYVQNSCEYKKLIHTIARNIDFVMDSPEQKFNG